MDEAMHSAPLAKELYQHGFDICHSFYPEWYNELIVDDGSNLEQFLPNDADTVCGAVLIANTRHVWSFFIDWYNKQSKDIENPLDVYCQETIGSILQRHGEKHGLEHSSFWSSTYSLDKLVSMQRVAMVSGFAYWDTNTQLSVHPTFGTWKSYRAVVVFQIPRGDDDQTPRNQSRCIGAVPQPPPRIPCLLTPDEQEQARLAMKRALDASDMSRLCDQLQGKGKDMDELCLPWIEMRDCVQTGKEYRFGQQQLMYHYTKDPKYLTPI
jgi:hypothetical protein